MLVLHDTSEFDRMLGWTGHVVRSFLRRPVMADANVKKFDIEVMDRQWIHSSLQAKRDQLVRARNKETSGSQVWVIRGQEIEQLNALINRFV